MMKLTAFSMITLTAVAASVYGCSSGGGGGGATGGSGTGATGGSGGTGLTGSGGTAGIPGGGGTTAACTNTNNNGLDATTSANNFFSAVYGFGDGDSAGANPSSDTDPGTTFCLDSPSDGTICMNGLGQEACAGSNPCDYHRWGAGIGLNLAMHDDTAGTVTAFDATAAGVTGVKFTLSGVTSPIRVQLTMVDDPATTDVNESTGFVYGGGTADVAADGTVTAQFDTFTQPAWGIATFVFDATKLDALQFQVPTVAGATTSYDFCVSDIQLVDATGATVTPPAGAGGAP